MGSLRGSYDMLLVLFPQAHLKGFAAKLQFTVSCADFRGGSTEVQRRIDGGSAMRRHARSSPCLPEDEALLGDRTVPTADKWELFTVGAASFRTGDTWAIYIYIYI